MLQTISQRIHNIHRIMTLARVFVPTISSNPSLKSPELNMVSNSKWLNCSLISEESSESSAKWNSPYGLTTCNIN